LSAHEDTIQKESVAVLACAAIHYHIGVHLRLFLLESMKRFVDGRHFGDWCCDENQEVVKMSFYACCF